MLATNKGNLSRRERERQQRVELILDSAEELFLKKGFSATTMNDIGEAAEFNRASLYHYFPSKEAIYVATVERGMDYLIATAKESVRQGTNAREKIQKLREAIVSVVSQRQNFFRLYFITRFEVFPYLSPELAERLQSKTYEMDSIFHGIFHEGVATGEFREDDHMVCGDIFFGQIIGLMLLNSTEKLERPWTECLEKATDLLIESLLKKAEG